MSKLKYPRRLESFNTGVSVASGGVIMLIGCFSVIEVICRGFFNSPTKWTADVNQYLLIWAIFLVSGYAFQAFGHVRVDILTRLVPMPGKRIMAITSYAICAAFVIILTRSSVAMFFKSIEQGTYTYAFLQIPRWILITAMLIGCAIMLVTLVCIIIDLIGKNEKYT